MKKFSKGFTLIELLVVIAIIGILSSVVLASLNTARQKARDSRRISDMQSLILALEIYANDNSGKYPSALADLVTGNYMPKIPTDPGTLAQAGGGGYFYASSNTTEYHLGADLESAGALPTNDAQCKSSATVICFTQALTGGFDGTATTSGTGARYDLKN